MKSGKPTAAMRAAAAEGLKLHEEGKSDPSMPGRTVDIGKKIASGQTLADEHINDMAHFHSSHDKCPKDCEDLLWGGPAGEIWAKSSLMRNLNTGFSEEKDLDTLIKDETNLSFEIFSDINLDEPVQLGEDDKGYIWAPILRSGMLATRPGPNGEKLDDPLVFIPGHSKDQRKEIGLQDIVDAYKDNAIEYVTIPETHENKTLENKGFIRDLRIVDSKKNPGEKVILAAHDFTEPDVKEKVQRGSVASRSSGILYDYKNTTTGKVYPVALEHTCLTNKPWVGGMAAYGIMNAEDFSDRSVVQMMLSEKPLTIDIDHPIEKIVPTKLAQETTISQIKIDKKEVKSEFLADIVWGEEPSYRDIERQIGSILEKMAGGDDDYPIYRCIDCNKDKALVKVNYGIGPDEDAWVVPYTVNDVQQVELSPFSEWIDAARKWVTDTVDPKEDKQQLDKLKMSDTNLSVLTSKKRKDLPKSSFVYPDDERYPIHDLAHGRNALARVSQNGSPEEQAKVKAAVYKKYPQLKPENTSTKMSDPLKAASAKRLGLSESSQYEPPGGHMTLLAMSEEQMERLGLSEEAKEIQRKQNNEIEKLNIKLAESESKEKETRVASRIEELKGEGFDAFPGLLKEIETTLLSDDGDVALKLQLSEHGHSVSVPETATQIAERFLKALPRKDGKVNFGEQANVLTAGVMDRPPLKPEDPDAKDKPKSADELLAQWAEDAPELKSELVALSSDNGKGK